MGSSKLPILFLLHASIKTRFFLDLKDNQFITDYQIPVMFDDSIQTIVPIENPVYTSAQIGTIFNSITYEKGASVMRMIEATVGETNFQQALNVCFC